MAGTKLVDQDHVITIQPRDDAANHVIGEPAVDLFNQVGGGGVPNAQATLKGEQPGAPTALRPSQKSPSNRGRF
jgi:hypothetical protein